MHTPSACDLRHCQRLFANYKLPANPTRRRRRYTSCGGDSAQSTNNSPRGMRRSPPWPTTERSPLRFIVRCSFLSQGTRRGSGYGDCYACMEARGCRFGQKCQDNSRLRIFFLFHRLHLRVELSVTVPVVQCTLTDMARSHVATEPSTVFFVGQFLMGKKKIAPWGPGGKVLSRGIIWRQGRGTF